MVVRVLAALGLLWAATTEPARAYVDHPLPGHDGFAGGPSCRACHTHLPEKADRGSLSLDGVPQRYRPGQMYSLTVTLEHADLITAGFQAGLHGRAGAGGSWTAVDVRTELMADTGIGYVQHSPDGTRTDTAGAAKWTLAWTAPRDGGDVTIAVAANAANDDQSALGDVILLLEVTTSPENAP